jgi:hypothetical protein
MIQEKGNFIPYTCISLVYQLFKMKFKYQLTLMNVPTFMATFIPNAPLHRFQVITFQVRHSCQGVFEFNQLITIWTLSFLFILAEDHIFCYRPITSQISVIHETPGFT